MEAKPKVSVAQELGIKSTAKKNYAGNDIYVPGGFGTSGNERNLSVGNIENIEDLRGENQATWDKVGNGAAKFVGKTALRTLGGFVTPFYGLGAMMANRKASAFYDNDFSNWLNQKEEELNEALPNYRTDEEKNSFTESVTGVNFYADSLLDGASFALAAYLSGSGIAKGIGAASKMLASGKTASQIIAEAQASGIDEGIATLGKIGQANKVRSAIQEGLGSFVGAANESAMEANGTYNSVRETLLQKKLAEKQRNGDFSEISEQESKQLDNQAADAGNANFMLNLAMTWGTNALQLGKQFRSYTNEAIDQAKVVGKQGEFAYDASKLTGVAGELEKISPKLGKVAANKWTLLGVDAAGEAAQEFGQTYSNELMATHFAGSTGSEERSWLDDMGKAFKKTFGKEGAESALLGALIGGLTGGATGALSEARRKNEAGEQAVAFANEHSLQNFLKEDKIQSFLRVNNLEKVSQDALKQGKKFDWLNLQTAKFHELVMGNYKIGKFDELIDTLETLGEATPDEAKEMFGLSTGEDTRAEFAKGLIEKAKATKVNYEKLMGLVGHQIGEGKITEDDIAQAALAGAIAGDMDTRMKSVKESMKAIGFDIDSSIRDRVENYRKDPEQRAQLLDEYNKEVKTLTSSLKAETDLGDKADPIKIDSIRKSIDKVAKNKNTASDYFRKQFDNDNYLDEFDTFAKDFLNDLNEKEVRKYANNQATPTNRKEFNDLYADYRKLEKAKKGFYEFYNEVVTNGQESKRLKKVRELVNRKKNDMWMDRWYGVYQHPKGVDDKGKDIISPRIQMEPGIYTWRGTYFDKAKKEKVPSAKQNIVEVLDRRLNNGVPEVYVKKNGADPVWDSVKSYRAIGLQRIQGKIGNYGSEQRDVIDLLNPEMQFYLKYKDRIIEYYQPKVAFIDKDKKPKIKDFTNPQGNGNTVRGMLAFNSKGNLVLRFIDSEGKLRTTLSGLAVKNGKLLRNAQGKYIQIPAFAVDRLTPGSVGGTFTAVPQGYNKIYTEEETTKYLFEQSSSRNIKRLQNYIETIKAGKSKDFATMAEIEAKIAETKASIDSLRTKLDKTLKPAKQAQLQQHIRLLDTKLIDLDYQIEVKKLLIERAEQQIASVEARPADYTYENLQDDLKQLSATVNPTEALKEEKELRAKAVKETKQKRAFALQLGHDLDALELAKNKINWAKAETQNKVVEWATAHITGPVAEDIVATLETDIQGITERFTDKALSFDDVKAILKAIDDSVSANDAFTIEYNTTKAELVNSLEQLSDTFAEQAMADLVDSYIREDELTPLLEAQEELNLINSIRDALTQDWSTDNQKPFRYGIDSGIYEAGDTFSEEEKSADNEYARPSVSHNGNYNPFLRTQTPRDATHNNVAFQATHLFNSKTRFEEGKYAYQLHTIDTLADAGIRIDNPGTGDEEVPVWMVLVKTSDQKPVMLDSLGNERVSGKYPHLSMLPAPNFKYAYTDKAGVTNEVYRFHDVNDDNVDSPEHQRILADYNAILSSVKTKLTNKEKVMWAINRKSFGIPKYDKLPNAITSVINDPNLATELFKPAELTADNKPDYTKTGDYYMYVSPTDNKKQLPGIPGMYPLRSGRTYLIDTKSKRVMPLVNRRLSDEDTQQLLLGLVYTSKESNKKVSQTTAELRTSFINGFAKHYVAWGNRVSQKKPTNAGYHIDFSDSINEDGNTHHGIVFGKYTGKTEEGKGLYGKDGKETSVSITQIEEYLVNGTTTPEVEELLSFLGSTYRHVSNFEMQRDYMPLTGKKQRSFSHRKYVLKNGEISEFYDNKTGALGYKSWLLNEKVLLSPLVPYKDTQTQYDGIYYGVRNEAPPVYVPKPRQVAKATTVPPVAPVAGTPVPQSPRVDTLKAIIAQFSDEGKAAITETITVLTASGKDINEVIAIFEQPAVQEAMEKDLPAQDFALMKSWYEGKVTVQAPVVAATTTTPAIVAPVTVAPTQQSVDDALIAMLPGAAPSTPATSSTQAPDQGSAFRKGVVFVLGGTKKYEVKEVIGTKVIATDLLTMTPVDVTFDLEDTMGGPGIPASQKNAGLKRRLQAGQIRFENGNVISSFVFMGYDENLMKEPKQDNLKKLGELQEYFKTRYGLDVAIASPRALYGNFAGYVKSAKRILLQEETPEGAEYHEEFHVVEKMLRVSYRNSLYNEYRKAMGDPKMTDLQVSEKLAEGFRYYVINEKGNAGIGQSILNFFKEIAAFLRSILFLEKTPNIKKFYKEIYAGEWSRPPKKSALKASAYNVSTRMALVDNMWINLPEVMKDFDINLVRTLRNYKYVGGVNEVKEQLDKKVEQKGGKTFLREILIRTLKDAPATLKLGIVENYKELERLFEDSLLRRLQQHEIDTEEEVSNDIKGHIQPANEVDHKSRIPAVIKTVLSTIPSLKNNNLGMPTASDVNTLLGKLYTTLAGKQSLDEMKDALMATGDKQLLYVVERFALDRNIASSVSPEIAHLALDTFMTQTQFVNHFAKQNVNYYTQMITSSGIMKLLDEQKSAVTAPKVYEWRRKIQQAIHRGTPYNVEGSNKRLDLWALQDAAEIDGAKVLRDLGFTASVASELGPFVYAQLRTLEKGSEIIPALTENWSRGKDVMLQELVAEGKDTSFHLQNAEGKTVNSIVEQSAASKMVEEYNKRPDVTHPVKVVSLAGLKPEGGLGSVLNDLGPRDSLLVQLNSVMAGIYPYVFTGSKSMSWGFKGLRPFHRFQDINDIYEAYMIHLEKEYNNITQWSMMKRDHTVLPKGYIANGGQLQVFRNILSPTSGTSSAITSLEKSAREGKPFAKAMNANMRNVLKTALETHTKARTEQMIGRLKQEQIIQSTSEGYQLFGLNAQGYTSVSALVNDLYVNSELANIQQWQEFIGDFSYYKDPLKRITALNATKQHADAIGRSLANYTAYAINTRSSSYIKKLIANNIDDIGLLQNVTIDDVSTSDESLAKEISTKYGDINVADGQGYGAMEHHRMLGFFEGWWNQDLEDIYQHEVDLEEKIERGQAITDDDLLPPKKVKQYWKVIKSQYFGPQVLDNHEAIAPNFLKFSVVPLLPSVTYGTELDKMRRWMNNNGVALVSMDSANKVGRLVTEGVNDKGETVYKGFSGENFNMDGAEPFIQQLHWKYYGTQTATSDQVHTKQTEGTQASKIILSDILAKPTMSTYRLLKDGTRESVEKNSREWVNDYLRTKSARIEREFNELKQKLGLLNRGNRYEFKDKNRIYDELKEAVKSRTDNMGLLIDLETLFDKGQPLDYLPKNLLDSLIWGLVKKPIKHKRFGDAKVQVSSAGFSKADGTLKQDSELKFYPKNEDGTSYAMQVKLPSWFAGQFTVGEIRKLDPRLLELVGFRIPTQALASIEYIEVVEFLPPDANFIVVPAPITVKAGSDFDVDKMNLYYPAVKYVNGVPTYIEEEGTDEDRYVDYINSVHKDLFSGESTGDRFGLAQMVAEQQEYPSYNEFSAWSSDMKLSVAALDNKLLEWEKMTLASSNNRQKLLSPNQDDNIKRVAYWVQLVNSPLDFKLSYDEFKALSKKDYEGWQRKLKTMRPIDLVNPMFLEDNRQSFLAGKDVLGAIAKNVTHHVLSQLAGLKLSGTYKKETITDDPDNEFQTKVVRVATDYEKPKFAVTDAGNLAKIRNVTGKDISDTLSEFVNASVDVEKDDYIKYINLNLDNASIYMYLIREGVDPVQVELFMSQPIVTEFTNRLALYKSESYRLQNGIPSMTQARNLAISHTIAEWGTGDRKRDFTQKELESGIRSPFSNRGFQADVFDEYLKYSGIGNEIMNLMSATDFDTKDTGSSYAENALRVFKYAQLVEKNTLFNTDGQSGVDGFMYFNDAGTKTLTPLGQAALITNTASSLFDELSLIERVFSYSHLKQDMIDPLLGSMYGAEKVAKVITKIKNHFMTYLLQNTKVGGKLAREKVGLLTGTNSMARQVQAIQSQKNHPLHNNYFITQLETNDAEGKDVDEVNMKKIMGDNLKMDQLYEAFMEIEDVDSELANNLIDYTIIRSGTHPSPISYHQAIPVKSIAERFGELDTYIPTEPFKQLFIQNNMNDPVVMGALGFRSYADIEQNGEYEPSGDGMYLVDYMLKPHQMKHLINTNMRQRMIEIIDPESLLYYIQNNGKSPEAEFGVSPSEEVSEAKLEQMIIEIQKFVCGHKA